HPRHRVEIARVVFDGPLRPDPETFDQGNADSGVARRLRHVALQGGVLTPAEFRIGRQAIRRTTEVERDMAAGEFPRQPDEFDRRKAAGAEAFVPEPVVGRMRGGSGIGQAARSGMAGESCIDAWIERYAV